VDLATGELYAARHCLPGDLPALRRPDPAELAAARSAAESATTRGLRPPPLATTLVVVATDATLTKAQCQKVSGVGHDGLARAVNPVHTMVDGDTVFTLATGGRDAPDPDAFHALLEAAGDVVTRAVGRAILAAESTHGLRSYRDAFPSALV
jgi:putative pantetheine hydrolase